VSRERVGDRGKRACYRQAAALTVAIAKLLDRPRAPASPQNLVFLVTLAVIVLLGLSISQSVPPSD